MKKDYLRENYKIRATGKMRKMAAEDMLEKTDTRNDSDPKSYKTEVYIRCKIVDEVLKVAFFLVRDLRMGSCRAAYELLIDKASGKFLTWDETHKRWRSAMLDKLGWPSCSWYSKTYISPKDNRLMKKYLEVDRDGFLGIYSYQLRVRKQQLEARHKRETDAWDLTLSQVPALPKDWNRWVDKHGIHQNYIFYDYSRKKNQTGYCTWCEKEVPIKNPKHNQKGKCPHCRHEIQYKAKGRAGRIQTELETAYLLQRCGDGLIIRQFEINKKYEREQYTTPSLNVFEERRVMLSNDFKATVFYYGNYKNVCHRWIKGEKKYNFYYFSYGSRKFEGAVYTRNLSFLGRTQLSRTGLPEMARILDKMDPEVYLEKLKESPSLEQLVKAGLAQIAQDVMMKRIKMDGRHAGELAKRLGIDRERMQRLRKNNGGYQYLAWLKYEKEQDTVFSDVMLRRLEQWDVMPSELEFILKKMSLVRIFNYLNRQHAESGREYKELISTWQDYLVMASRLKMQTEQEIIYKPKDLLKQHDEAIKLCGGVETVERAVELLHAYPDIDHVCQTIKTKYEFEDEKYRIIVPEKTEDIIVEGSVLGHCLHWSDTYFDRIQRRESYIVFLRKTENPDVPYYTLEIEPDGTTRQKRTVGDKQNADFIEAKRFIAKWQRAIQKRLTKEDLALAKASAALREQEFKKLRKDGAKIWHGHLAGQLLADVLEADLMEARLSMEEMQEMPQAA